MGSSHPNLCQIHCHTCQRNVMGPSHLSVSICCANCQYHVMKLSHPGKSQVTVTLVKIMPWNYLIPLSVNSMGPRQQNQAEEPPESSLLPLTLFYNCRTPLRWSPLKGTKIAMARRNQQMIINFLVFTNELFCSWINSKHHSLMKLKVMWCYCHQHKQKSHYFIFFL